MTRLTNDDRNRIITNAINKSRLNDSRTLLDNEEYEIGEAIRVESLGGADEVKRLNKLIVDMDKVVVQIPDYALTQRSLINRKDYFYVGLGESAIRQIINLRNYEVVNGGQYNLVHTSPLFVRFRDWQTRRESHDRACKAMRDEIRASISGCNTRNQLLKAWPEAIELLPDSLKPTAKTNLPALKTSRLNALIGLPSKGDKTK